MTMNLDELRAALAALPADTPGSAPVYMEHEHPYASEMARQPISGIRVQPSGPRYGIYLEPTA